jgi:hypothetical protein
MERSADTRRKIQLGGLVIKAGLADEPAAILLGLLVEAARALKGDKGPTLRARFKQVGDHAFISREKNASKDP